MSERNWTRYEFPEGLPAFETETRFRLVEPPEIRPLSLLESETTAGLRFVCAPVEALAAGYRLELSEAERALLMAGPESPLCLLAIVTFPEGGAPTANLRAPLALNPAGQVGMQVVRADGRYSMAHPLRPDGGGGACW